MGDPAKAIDLLRDRIVQVHMKDGIKAKTVGTWGEEVPAGEGQVDWESFFETVSSLSDRVHVFIERESGTQRVQDIIKAKEIALSYGCQQ